MNINISLELPKDRALLTRLLEFYDAAESDDKGGPAVLAPKPEPKKPAKPTAIPILPSAAKPKEVVQVDIDSKPTTTHTRESIRAIAYNKKKDDVRALLTEFGVEGLTKLLPAQYDAFMVSLNKLS